MMTEPQGPIYMLLRRVAAEQPLTRDVPMPPADFHRRSRRLSHRIPRPCAAPRHARAAKHPVILVEYVGRDARGFDALVDWPRSSARRCYDLNLRLNFPSVIRST